MKKLVYYAIATILAITLFTFTAQAKAKKTINKSKIIALIEELQADAAASGDKSDHEAISLPGIKIVSDNNLQYISIGKLGLNIAKLGGKRSESKSKKEESRAAVAALDGLERLIILSYDECKPELKEKFSTKIAAALSDYEMLLEAKDDDSISLIYGEVCPEGNMIKNVIMFTPNDEALICLFGTFDAAQLKELSETAL